MKMRKIKTRAVLIFALLTLLLMAWAPWFTEEYAINKVTEKLGGPDAQFGYLGETMAVKDVPKNVVKVPFVSLVYFPSEAMYIVTFYGGIWPESTTTQTSPKGQIIVKQSGGAAMLDPICGDKNYIINESNYIVEGTVEKVESRWNADKSSILTYTTIAVKNYVKGTPFTENELTIITPGGTVGEITETVEDQPIFHAGKKVRVYFKETNGEFSIVCAQMGVEEV